VVDGRGYILTLWPFRDKVPLSVRLGNQREYPAKVVAINDERSLVVLKIQPPQLLPAISLSKFPVPQKGDVVFAVPSPAQKSAARGVVTAVEQKLGKRFPRNLIQTDGCIKSIPNSLATSRRSRQSPINLWSLAVLAGKNIGILGKIGSQAIPPRRGRSRLALKRRHFGIEGGGTRKRRLI
jgi:S1-C subfamily serine protease